MLRPLPILILLLLFCTSMPGTSMCLAGNVTPDRYKGRQLVVGWGGGVTGAATTYYLLRNGRLFVRQNRDSVYTFVNRQRCATTRKLFRQLEKECQIKSTTFDQPGNRYQFAGWRKRNRTYRVTWGDRTGGPPPAGYKQFYSSFMALLPANNS